MSDVDISHERLDEALSADVLRGVTLPVPPPNLGTVFYRAWFDSDAGQVRIECFDPYIKDVISYENCK